MRMLLVLMFITTNSHFYDSNLFGKNIKNIIAYVFGYYLKEGVVKLEYDYKSIRYTSSKAEISGELLTLTQTYLLDNFPTPHIVYSEITVFSKENKQIKTTQTFQSSYPKEIITLGENTVKRIKKESCVKEYKTWARKLLFSFYHSLKVISKMELTYRFGRIYISTNVFMDDFDGRIHSGYCNDDFDSLSLSQKEDVPAMERQYIELIDKGSFLSESIQKTKENILSYPSFRLRKLFLNQ